DTSPIVLTDSDLPDFSVSIPDGTEVQGPEEWDGIIMPPTDIPIPSGDAPAGFSVGDTVIFVGSPDGTLVFDQAVTIVLPNVTGPVGYRPSGSDTWTQITNTCGGEYATPDAPTTYPGECKITNNTDTKIVTFHFTSFGEFIPDPTPTPTPTPGHSGGGGGPGCAPGTAYNPSTSSCTPVGQVLGTSTGPGTQQGQVLGAATFNFTRNLGVGLSGDDVIELQKILIAAGLLKIDAPTGNFGQLTKAAVQAFQKEKGIANTGFVGPLTRGELNKGSASSGVTVDQMNSILTVLQSFDVDQSIIDKVRAALSR
ncbi:MAG: peptidoglycan-binding domain-containing protein, partial [bacterium]|nr:peptidoglycan-binding domain-containing protein [bacterium]